MNYINIFERFLKIGWDNNKILLLSDPIFNLVEWITPI
jgi:hypothetical protein